MGRPRIKLDLTVIEQIRRAEPELGLRRLALRLYARTKQNVSFMTLWRRLREAGPTGDRVPKADR